MNAVVASEPGAVATGERFNFENEEFAKRMDSIGPVATAPGSDVQSRSGVKPRQNNSDG